MAFDPVTGRGLLVYRYRDEVIDNNNLEYTEIKGITFEGGSSGSGLTISDGRAEPESSGYQEYYHPDVAYDPYDEVFLVGWLALSGSEADLPYASLPWRGTHPPVAAAVKQ